MMKKILKFVVYVLIIVCLGKLVVVYGRSEKNVQNDSAYWKDKVDPYILKIMDEEDVLPVWIWMEDIDHDEVKKKVLKKTGLNENNLKVVNENISEELAIEISALSSLNNITKKQTERKLQNYLERTEYARKEEAKRTDTYLKELRKTQAEMLREKK